MSTRFTICTAHPFSLPRTFSPCKLCSLFPVLFYLFSHIVQHRHFVYISESPPFSKLMSFFLSTFYVYSRCSRFTWYKCQLVDIVHFYSSPLPFPVNMYPNMYSQINTQHLGLVHLYPCES